MLFGASVYIRKAIFRIKIRSIKGVVNFQSIDKVTSKSRQISTNRGRIADISSRRRRHRGESGVEELKDKIRDVVRII
jgi:hypothetical protein